MACASSEAAASGTALLLVIARAADLRFHSTSFPLEPIDFFLKLGNPPELNVEIVAHLVHDLATCVQEIDQVVELVPRDGRAA